MNHHRRRSDRIDDREMRVAKFLVSGKFAILYVLFWAVVYWVYHL